ncbi:MAG: ATP synthase F1 subunit delta [Pseudomonadota bacterium]
MTTPKGSSVSDVAKRYAEAVFELALAKDELSAVDSDLKSVRSMAEESDDLMLLLDSPAFQKEDKVTGLVEVARKAGLSTIVVNFIGTMAQNGRASDLLGAAIAFDTLYTKHQGIQRAVAITAHEMNSTQAAQLKDILGESIGSDIELETQIDPDLIGGIQLRIGSKLIDASIATKLNRMNMAMKGA